MNNHSFTRWVAESVVNNKRKFKKIYNDPIPYRTAAFTPMNKDFDHFITALKSYLYTLDAALIPYYLRDSDRFSPVEHEPKPIKYQYYEYRLFGTGRLLLSVNSETNEIDWVTFTSPLYWDSDKEHFSKHEVKPFTIRNFSYLIFSAYAIMHSLWENIPDDNLYHLALRLFPLYDEFAEYGKTLLVIPDEDCTLYLKGSCLNYCRAKNEFHFGISPCK